MIYVRVKHNRGTQTVPSVSQSDWSCITVLPPDTNAGISTVIHFSVLCTDVGVIVGIQHSMST